MNDYERVLSFTCSRSSKLKMLGVFFAASTHRVKIYPREVSKMWLREQTGISAIDTNPQTLPKPFQQYVAGMTHSGMFCKRHQICPQKSEKMCLSEAEFSPRERNLLKGPKGNIGSTQHSMLTIFAWDPYAPNKPTIQPSMKNFSVARVSLRTR